jgi:RimJ/RimL family protein N-acetyltransferase
VTVILHALLLEIPEVVESDRLTLVAARAGQGAAVNEAVAESRVELKDWMPWARKAQSLEESEAYCREAQSKWLSREMLDFSLVRRDDARLVGRGGLHAIDWSLPKFEIGYWIRTSCARQGYATEAAGALTRLAAERLGARRVEIRCDARNAASRRVAEKCGFALEGILHNSRRDAAGALADSCLYARVF